MTTASRRPAATLAVVVALFTFVCYLPALGADFVSWDDERNFLTNPHFRGLGLTQLKWMWSTTLLGHYVPLSWMTLGFDYTLWGMNPRGYHLTNVVFHAANAVLVFYLARRLFARGATPVTDIGAAVSALVFAAHPLRVESVAWITERRDVVSGFFCLLAVLLYLRSIDGASRRTRTYVAAILCFVAALLSKGTSVTVPAVLLLLNVYPLRRIGGGAGWWSESARRAYAELIPFAIPAAAFMVSSVVALHPPGQLPVTGKLAVSAYSLVFYVMKTLLPLRLSPLYGMPTTVDPLAGRFLAAYAGALVFLVVVLVAWKRNRGLATGLLVFAAVSLPMLGIVQNGPQIAADRYTYHSGPALAILVGAGFLTMATRWSFRMASIIATVAVVALAAMTWRQVGVWHDSTRLWARVLELEPDSPLGNSAWANLLYKQNKVDEAIEYSMRAVRSAPELAEGHNDLGVGLARKGEFAEAIRSYQTSLTLKPGFDEAENNWGVVLAGLGQLDSAVAHYRRALAYNADNADAEVNWGNVLVRAGRSGEAIEHYRRALWIRPDHADAELNWGVALARDAKYADAITHFQSALAIDPSQVEAREYMERATQLLRARPPR